MSDVQDFIREKALQPTRSALAPYTAEILELRELGFSYRVIAEFLHEKKGVKTSFQNVAAFIRSYHAGSLKTVNVVTEVAPTQSQARQPQNHTTKNTSLQHNSRKPPTNNLEEQDPHPINTGFKKFNSREMRESDVDDLF